MNASQSTPDPVSAQSLLAGAEELASALTLLAAAGRPPARAVGILAAHSLELGLKAFLLAEGWTEQRLKDGIGHNLIAAWTEASSAQLGTPSVPPPWCELLASLHRFPYVGRYPPSNSGLVVPNATQVQGEVSTLLRRIRNRVHAA